jgi:hypothetical protein
LNEETKELDDFEYEFKLRGIGGGMTTHLSPDVQHMCPKSPGTTQF